MASFTFSDFIQTDQGQRLYDWETPIFDRLVINAFGGTALQVGAPCLPCLRENRMQTHIQTFGLNEDPFSMTFDEHTLPVMAQPEALPFPKESMDLVILPHTLDFADSPHHALREAVRVLEPEGRLILSVFNPFSLWWLRQRFVTFGANPYLPSHTCPIGLSRLKDWLTLLGLEIDQGHFGVYTPAFHKKHQFERWAWMDKAGDRWWPHGANLIVLSAIKRLPGVKLIGQFRFSRNDPVLSGAPQVGISKDSIKS